MIAFAKEFDVAVVGAGIVGCRAGRQIKMLQINSRYSL